MHHTVQKYLTRPGGYVEDSQDFQPNLEAGEKKRVEVTKRRRREGGGVEMAEGERNERGNR